MESLESFNIHGDLLDLSINDNQTQAFNDLTLIGLIISDKTINFRATKAILHSVWDLSKSIQVFHLDRNMFACVFGSAHERDEVSSTSPWSIKGNIIVLRSWSPDLALDEVDFRFNPF